jgi:hypothetical protein
MDKGSALSAIALLETEHFLPYHAPNPDTPQTLKHIFEKLHGFLDKNMSKNKWLERFE